MGCMMWNLSNKRRRTSPPSGTAANMNIKKEKSFPAHKHKESRLVGPRTKQKRMRSLPLCGKVGRKNIVDSDSPEGLELERGRLGSHLFHLKRLDRKGRGDHVFYLRLSDKSRRKGEDGLFPQKNQQERTRAISVTRPRRKERKENIRCFPSRRSQPTRKKKRRGGDLSTPQIGFLGRRGKKEDAF